MGRVYVDNPQNRRLGRVGLPHGTAVKVTKKSGRISNVFNYQNSGDNDDMFTSNGGDNNSYHVNASNNNSVAEAPIGVRMGFLRKVYGILLGQVAVMVTIGTVMVASDEVQEYVQQSPGIMLVTMVASLICFFALLAYRKETPINFLLLATFTLLESYLVGVIVTLYTVPSVIQALTITVGLFVGLTLFTMQTKQDFTSWHGPLTMALWVLIVIRFVQMFYPMPHYDLAISLGAALLFCGFVVVDTQLIMRTVSEEEYIYAVLSLYLDIVNLFLNILRIFGEKK